MKTRLLDVALNTANFFVCFVVAFLFFTWLSTLA